MIARPSPPPQLIFARRMASQSSASTPMRRLTLAEAKPLMAFLKAASKKVIDNILTAVFAHRRGTMPVKYKEVIASALQLTPAQLDPFLRSTAVFLRYAVYSSRSDADVAAVLPDSFHPQLKQLLSVVVGARLEQWRSTAISSQLSLPKLESMDWRVDVQSSSESLSRMAVPSVFVELRMCDSNVSRASEPKRETVTFEMTQDTLAAMLDGLGKIREQLNSVASTSQ
mmetsp:Transcript_47753/g.120209  ORF Transcript_47753/g.120209 Transcript_47753/m.120209 type:complete len:227 (+) Transcript_47753:3-683(+)